MEFSDKFAYKRTTWPFKKYFLIATSQSVSSFNLVTITITFLLVRNMLSPITLINSHTNNKHNMTQSKTNREIHDETIKRYIRTSL